MSAEIPPCDQCGREQRSLGALLFGPPNEDGYTLKRHICHECYSSLSTMQLTAEQEKAMSGLAVEAREHGVQWPAYEEPCIRFMPEYRKGRGRDMHVMVADSDKVMYRYLDVYGNGVTMYGSVSWECSDGYSYLDEGEPCEVCYPDGDPDA